MRLQNQFSKQKSSTIACSRILKDFSAYLVSDQLVKRHDENANAGWEAAPTVYIKDSQVLDQENIEALIIVLFIYLTGPKHPAFFTYWGFSK